MAIINLTRKTDFIKKKNTSVSAARVAFGDIPLAVDTYQLFNLPADCLITAAYVIPHIAGQATLTIDLNFGATPLIVNADVDDTAVKKDAGISIDTGTGGIVTVSPDADPTAGDFTFIVEYIEYDRTNGEFTRLI